MKRFSLYIIILYNVLLLTACHDTLETPEDPTPQPRAEAERTVIVYMAADNSLSTAVKADTAEMREGKDHIPENVNFIIYLDTKQQKPAIYELSAKGGMQLWKQYDVEHCSTDASTMSSVLKEIEHYFPARHYGITFWSHATGWAPERNSSRQRTFGQDETYSTTGGVREMDIPVLRDVLAGLPGFDYIFFDACFMQCIEVAYELRNTTHYMIGSPAEIPGPGAPYDMIMEPLCKGDVTGIINGYASGYPLDEIYIGVLLSCIDCTQLDALAQATGQFLTPFYIGHSEPPSYYGFLPYCTDPSKYTFCYDMRTTMHCLLSQEDYTIWMEAFDLAVPEPLRILSDSHAWYALHCNHPFVENPDCYGGVSMFLPGEAYDAYGRNTDFQKTSWYAATGWQVTGW